MDFFLLIGVALAIALAAIAVFLLLRIKEYFAREVVALLDGRHREMLSDLHNGLARQGDRVAAAQAETGERLRTAVSAELGQTRDRMQNLEVSQTQRLAALQEEMARQLAQLILILQQKQDALKSEMLAVTLEKLSDQGRANQLHLHSSIEALTRTVDARLGEIAGKVNERLDEGFKKTNETFVSVMTRLQTIDDAQKKIEILTSNVVSLQELLGDKRSRGAFGEVQLSALVANVLPESAYEMQYTFPGGARVDCVLKLPEPTGMVAVDSKFPLENYHRMFSDETTEGERNAARSQFKLDIKKHVEDISRKYIIPGVTSDGAVMFIPAEAVFAEIHARHPDVVDFANHKRVWIVSPTTLMAVLNTARAVMKDVETRRQIHIIKDELAKLGGDFGRFQLRMDNLARHIDQAKKDVDDVHVSSRKISERFAKIERVELDHSPGDALPSPQHSPSEEQ
jgi:DNA recombination protein RmuC